MPTRILMTAVVILSSIATFAAEPKRPSLVLEVPLTQLGQLHHRSNLLVVGRVDSPVKTNVVVLAYYVRDDGRLIPFGGVKVSPSVSGQFHCDFRPAEPGWQPGTLRIVASLTIMPHIRSERDIKIAAPENEPQEWVYSQPASSGINIDLDKAKGTIVVPTGQRFMTHASFPMTTIVGIQHRIVVRLIKRNSNAQEESLFERTPTLLPNDNHEWFEIEMTAPDEIGDYEVHVEIRGRPGNNILRRVPIQVVDPVASAMR